MQQRSERVVLETARHTITGTITLPAEGYRSRISDYLNASDRDFIALTDAVLAPHDSTDEELRYSFLAVARRQIVFVAPEGDEDNSGWLPPEHASHQV